MNLQMTATVFNHHGTQSPKAVEVSKLPEVTELKTGAPGLNLNQPGCRVLAPSPHPA